MINNLRKLRLQKGVTIKKLSDMMEYGDPSRIHHLEGANDLLLSTAYRLAKVLDCKIEDIFEQSE